MIKVRGLKSNFKHDQSTTIIWEVQTGSKIWYLAFAFLVNIVVSIHLSRSFLSLYFSKYIEDFNIPNYNKTPRKF